MGLGSNGRMTDGQGTRSEDGEGPTVELAWRAEKIQGLVTDEEGVNRSSQWASADVTTDAEVVERGDLRTSRFREMDRRGDENDDGTVFGLNVGIDTSSSR